MLLAFVVLMVSCDKFEGDVTKPSYLQINAINLVDSPNDSWSQESGFFTHDINAVEIVLWQEGDDSETELGVFTLPCKIPVLKKGVIDMVRITPVVKQNGISGSRIAYPYYEYIELSNVKLATDSLTNLDTLTTHYISKSLMKVRWQEYFEPGPGGVSLDTVVERLVYKPDTVRSGYGCGVIRVADSVESQSFWTSSKINLNSDEVTYLYLEMDYWSDFDFSVGMKNPRTQGGSDVVISAVTLYGRPEQGWKKIYINLGKIWIEQYGYYPDVRLYFTILNSGHKSGKLLLDNMKLVTM